MELEGCSLGIAHDFLCVMTIVLYLFDALLLLSKSLWKMACVLYSWHCVWWTGGRHTGQTEQWQSVVERHRREAGRAKRGDRSLPFIGFHRFKRRRSVESANAQIHESGLAPLQFFRGLEHWTEIMSGKSSMC